MIVEGKTYQSACENNVSQDKKTFRSRFRWQKTASGQVWLKEQVRIRLKPCQPHLLESIFFNK